MRIMVMLALLALVWADSPPQTLSKVSSSGPQPTAEVTSNKEKEKRTTGKTNITPGIKYALPHQQSPSLPAQLHAQYIPQQQLQQQQQQLQQQQQQQQVYSTIPQQYLQQSYQPQFNLQYLSPQPQPQQYILPQQQQVRYQFVPKGQAAAAEVTSNQITASQQQQQQYIVPQQQQHALAYAQPQAYLLPQSQQQYFAGGLGGYLLPGHHQQSIIMLAVPAPQYDAGLLGLYQGAPSAHQGRTLQLLGSAGGGGYQQQYLIPPQQQQHAIQQQLAYLLNQHTPQQQQQQPVTAAPLSATHNPQVQQNPHYTQRSAGGQGPSGPVQLRQQQQYKS